MEMKIAKASKEDIDRCVKFFQFVEEFMEHGTHTPEGSEDTIDLEDEQFIERLRKLWGGRFEPPGVDCSWRRVVFGCDILIDNVCDPDADTLEWKPELAAKLGEEE